MIRYTYILAFFLFFVAVKSGEPKWGPKWGPKWDTTTTPKVRQKPCPCVIKEEFILNYDINISTRFI